MKEATSGRDESFGLVSLPLLFKWDRSDNLLDPTVVACRSTTSRSSTPLNDLVFNKSKLEYSHYFKVFDKPRVVLAGRSAIGTLFGAARADVPANLRFYAGGGGSVRGFAYQTAGELDDEHDPIGGRSLFEASGEVRVRVTETIGVVAFVDAGTAFTSTFPDFDDQLRIGVGPGVRYSVRSGHSGSTSASGETPRSDAFQLYISLGQAF